MRCDVCKSEIIEPIIPIKIKFDGDDKPVEISRVEFRGKEYRLCQSCLSSFLIYQCLRGEFEFAIDEEIQNEERKHDEID